MKAPSLRDVARRAGTSTAVVSYVLNDGPRPVAAATRHRVEVAIAELGYRPNELARGLRRSRTASIGLVVPDLRKPFFAETAAAVEDVAEAHGHRLLVSSSRFDSAREVAQVGALVDARVDGVIIAPAGVAFPAARLLGRVPTVVAYRAPEAVEVPGDVEWRPIFVRTDDRGAGRDAAAHLLAHGRRRLACLAGPLDGTPVGLRAEGFASAVRASARSEPIIAECDFADLAHNAYLAARELLSADSDVDGICAATDDQALGALRAISDSGRRAGEDVGLVAIGGTSLTDFLTPPLSVVRSPVDDLATRCVSVLLALLNGDDVTEPDPLPMTLVRRASCGC